jgi:OmpA-OmpF porin, OOP family
MRSTVAAPPLRLVRALLLVGPAALSGFAPPPARAQEGGEQVSLAEERLAQGRADRLFLLAPRSFERAEASVAAALSLREAGATAAEVESAARDAQAALAEAERSAAVTRPALADALRARERAVAAAAPDAAPREWSRAEQLALELGRRAERGDVRDAAERSARAVEAFRQAEVEAIRVVLLGPAQEARRAAGELDARRRAPATLARADTLLAEAETVIRARPDDLARAAKLAEEAGAEYRHAAHLAALADSLDRRRISGEEVLLRHERRLARIASELDYEPELEAGPDSVAERTAEAARSLQEDRSALRRDVAARSAEIERLNAEVDRLDARLADVEQREAAVAAELRERQRRERRLREVAAIFSPEEAEVVATPDRVTVRLYGLTFPSGSAEIRPENFSTLTKLERVVREFPEGRITVEGHTDSVGNDDVNQALSQRRAIAVRDWLLQGIAISAERISAVGRGESRPIAPNDTAAGRDRNRRIEVVIDIPSD